MTKKEKQRKNKWKSIDGVYYAHPLILCTERPNSPHRCLNTSMKTCCGQHHLSKPVITSWTQRFHMLTTSLTSVLKRARGPGIHHNLAELTWHLMSNILHTSPHHVPSDCVSKIYLNDYWVTLSDPKVLQQTACSSFNMLVKWDSNKTRQGILLEHYKAFYACLMCAQRQCRLDLVWYIQWLYGDGGHMRSMEQATCYEVWGGP